MSDVKIEYLNKSKSFPVENTADVFSFIATEFISNQRIPQKIINAKGAVKKGFTKDEIDAIIKWYYMTNMVSPFHKK